MSGGSVLWFRHGLRLHDNPALLAALRDLAPAPALDPAPAAAFFPVFIFDGETAGTALVGYNRMRYLLEALADLDAQLRHHGGRLLVLRGAPDRVLRALADDCGVGSVCFEQDCEPVWAARDAAVRRACRAAGVAVRELVSHTLWEPRAVIRANGGLQPLTYQMFLHTVATIGPPPRPAGDAALAGVRFGVLPARFYTEFTVYDEIPKPEDFGIHVEAEEADVRVEEADVRARRWRGGETSALRQMERRLAVERDTFRRGSCLPTHDAPDLVGPPVSLSPALRFGCLSVRKFYWSIQDLFREVNGGRLDATHSITGQLIWREYFYTMSVNNPQYGQVAGNPICLRIPWRGPQPGELQRWRAGRTGFPFIDAAMRQLAAEGWLHHAARNAVAAFLTRGTLWLSWEHGLRHFLRYLLDADWSVCAGNWMWVSSSAFEALLDASECACPVRLGRRLDPRGEYVRRYVRELARMPLDYIYEPWRAPLEVQQTAGCVVGRDYPAPMVDHAARAQLNRAAMQELRSALQHKPPPPHCCPSSEEEVRRFMWLQEDVPAPAPAPRPPSGAD